MTSAPSIRAIAAHEVLVRLCGSGLSFHEHVFPGLPMASSG